MAKKKTDETESPNADGLVDRIYESVRSDYGNNILVNGTSVIEDTRQLIPISPSLDIITGGIEEGSWVGITGNPKTGKTTTVNSFAATCQRPEYGSRPIFYGKVEGRLSTKHLQAINGLDLTKFNIIQSDQGKILTAQDHLRIYEKILRTIPNVVLIIDSISALCDEREMIGGVGTETRGGGAKLFSQWLNTMSNVVPVNRCIVIGITHLMCNTSGMGAQYIEKASRRWHYQTDYKLRTITAEAWKAGEKQIGLKIKWKCLTSSQVVPGMTIDSFLRFGTGIDRLYEAFTFGTAAGLIKKSGAWYTLDFVGGETPPKAQGGEGVYRLLMDNPEWARQLEQEVVKLASGFAGSEGD